LVADPEEVVIPGELHELSALDLAGHLPGGVDREVEISDPGQYERRDVDRSEGMADVHAVVHPFEGDRRTWAGGPARVARQPGHELGVIGGPRRRPRSQGSR